MRALACVLAVSVCLLPAGDAAAVGYDDHADGPFGAAGTWTPAGGPPASGDTARISLHAVTLDGSLTGAAAPDRITLAGGTLEHPGWSASYDVDSPIDVTAASTVGVPVGGDDATAEIALNRALAGAGRIVATSNQPQSGLARVARLVLGGGASSFSGGWDVGGGLELRVDADGALGTGAVDINGGVVNVNAVQSYTTKPVIRVHTGGTFAVDTRQAANAVDLDVEMCGGTLAGGTLDNSGYGKTTLAHLAGAVTLHEDSFFATRAAFDAGLRITGPIRGPGKLTVSAGCFEEFLYLARADNTHSGGMDVVKGRVVAEAARTLGAGAVNVSTAADVPYWGPWTVLQVAADQAYAPAAQPLITIRKNAVYKVNGSVDPDVTVKDGWVMQDAWSGSIMTGVLTVDGAATLRCGASWSSADLGIAGLIRDGAGAGKLIVNYGAGPREVDVTHAHNTFSGGVEVEAGQLRAAAANCLGTGVVNVGAGVETDDYWDGHFHDALDRIAPMGGRLQSAAAGALDGPSAVNINANGVLDIRSTETRRVHVNTGGALMTSGGATAFDYDPASGGQNVALQQGAILHDSLGAGLPTYAVVAALSSGDGRFGVYQGRSGAWSRAGGDWVETPHTDHLTLGDDGSGNICRGLAALNNHKLTTHAGQFVTRFTAFTYAGVATEAAASTDGIGFYAQTGSWLALDGAAGCVLDAPNGVIVNGGGTVDFKGVVGGSFPSVDKYGAGLMRISDNAGLSGKTVTVHQGTLVFGTNAAPDGAAIVVGPGAAAAVRLDRDISGSSGSVTVEAGGYAVITNNSGVTSSNSAVVILQPGSKIALTHYDLGGAPVLRANGCDVVMFYDSRDHRLPGDGAEMGDGGLLTFGGDMWGLPRSEAVPRQGGGPGIALAAAAAVKEVGIAAAAGTRLEIFCPVHLGAGGTLVVGHAGPYDLLNLPGGVEGEAATAMTGSVDLRDDYAGENSFDTLRVDSGRARIMASGNDAPDPATAIRSLGGAASVDLNGGDVGFYVDSFTNAMTITGSGQVDVGYHAWGSFQHGSKTVTLQSTATVTAGIKPGHGVGRVDLLGGLRAEPGAGGEKATMEIEVIRDGGVGGAHHDLVTVSRSATLAADAMDLTLVLPAPNSRLRPSALHATFLTTADGLTGAFSAVHVASPRPLNPAVTAAAVASRYDVSGVGAAGSIVYTADAALVGGAGMWTAHAGDATLDDAVDVYDLSALANNYQVVAPQDWTTADYDLSGTVDVFDLAELANNYGWSAGGPVPEPAGLALLALGACLPLLRRRRQGRPFLSGRPAVNLKRRRPWPCSGACPPGPQEKRDNHGPEAPCRH